MLTGNSPEFILQTALLALYWLDDTLHESTLCMLPPPKLNNLTTTDGRPLVAPTRHVTLDRRGISIKLKVTALFAGAVSAADVTALVSKTNDVQRNVKSVNAEYAYTLTYTVDALDIGPTKPASLLVSDSETF
jgi:hypothetical protein